MNFSLESVLSSLQEGVILFDKTGKITFLNSAAERIIGSSTAVIAHRNLSEIFTQNKNLLQRVEQTLQTGHSFTIREDELNNRSGESFVVEMHLEPIHSNEGQILGACLALHDRSMVKKMEDELRHADRLAIMGTIASGLAHEIKNPLGGIKGAAQMLAREIHSLFPSKTPRSSQDLKNKELQEYLQIITFEANRVNELIGELLNFAKPKKIKSGSVNLHKILDEIIQLEEQASQKPIHYLRHYDPSLPRVKGDENQLKQVFLNLIKNAREVLKEGGKIEISTRLVTDYQLKTQKGGTSRFVAISIKDNGPGMDEEALAHLFAPFYTTKKAGTGLGLAISHRIINEHQGFIQVESKPKKGSTFIVYLRAPKSL